MDAKIDREDAKKLIQVVLHKGDVSFSNLKDVLDKAGVLKDAEIIEKYELKAEYADNHATAMKEIEQAKSMRVELSNKVKDVLEANGYDIPVLSEEEKNERITSALRDLGFSDEEVDKFLKDGVDIAETTGKGFTLNFKNDESLKKLLEDKGIDFEEQGENIKVKGKLFISEGFEIDNTAENRLKLEAENIKFFQKAEDERKLFVPLRAKKVATLLALGIVAGPIGALAIQVVLNQTGLLNKMIDQHQLSFSQKEALKQGFTVMAMQRENGKDVKQFMYVDKETGKINRVNVNDIYIPKKIEGVDLTPAQMQSLKNGKNVNIEIEGVQTYCRLDLNEPTGVKIAGFKEFKSDRTFTDIPKPNSPDEDKLRYISLRGKQGIDDIYGRNGDKLERDTFLDKYNLKEHYYQIDMAVKAGGSPLSAASMAIKEKVAQLKDLAATLLFGIEEEQSKGQKR